ncbi:hypothetical protein KUCAC02_026574, partial [Chaenocephalus aceratus]
RECSHRKSVVNDRFGVSSSESTRFPPDNVTPTFNNHTGEFHLNNKCEAQTLTSARHKTNGAYLPVYLPVLIGRTDVGGFEQDVENGYQQSPDTCHDVLATTRKQNTALDSAYGKTTPTSASSTYHVAAFPKEAGDPDRGTGPDAPPPVGEQGSPDSEPISVEMEARDCEAAGSIRAAGGVDKEAAEPEWKYLLFCLYLLQLCHKYISQQPLGGPEHNRAEMA